MGIWVLLTVTDLVVTACLTEWFQEFKNREKVFVGNRSVEELLATIVKVTIDNCAKICSTFCIDVIVVSSLEVSE